MTNPQTGVTPNPIPPGGHTTNEENAVTESATAPVGLCHHCDQPVMPGEEDRRTIATGGASGGGDILLHKGSCKPAGEAPRRHN